MNILMLTNTYLPHVGGVARSVHAFSEQFRRRGHRVLIVAPQFEGAPAEEVDILRLPAIQNFNGSDFSVRIPVPGMLTAALDAFKPDIVHSHHPFLLGDTAVRIAASRKVPLVFTHHTLYEQYTHYVPGESALLSRFVIDLTTGYTNFCDCVIAPSQSVAALLRKRGVVAPIEVNPTGVDERFFAQGNGGAFRREFEIPAEAFLVGHVGRLAPEKNLPFLAEAVAAFLRKHKQAHFLVVGSGPSEEAIVNLFRAPRFQGRLHMAGSCTGQRLVDAYHAMDVFAFASKSETQGMVLTEAMAAGLPVVALDASGVREVIIDGVNGRMLPKQQVRSFAAALYWVSQRTSQEREALRRAARATAKRFSLSRTADRALAIYESATARMAAAQETEPGDAKSGAAEGAWETALRLIEAEWQIWSNRAQAAGATLKTRDIFRVPVVGTALYGWRTIRRWCSRSEWGARILRLPPSTVPAEHGLILIQIDGLSRMQLERALQSRRMPFLRKLLARESYEVHTHYSGVPSTTAAVQGELFYGVKGVVPAFSYAKRETGQLVTMLDPQVAAEVQTRVARQNPGLLAGGSAFCNIYSGDAAEPHFCAAAMGWGNLLQYANPLRIALFLLWNAGSILRIAALVVLELCLAIIDCFRGVIRGHELVRELKFIPSRVGVTILLRELMTIGAGMDAARGLPVIELNFLGYDEQSHRRGPGSAFAHWSLKGIDEAIARVWNAARQSHRRDYLIWIYSDHGQEKVIPYTKFAGRPIGEAVDEVFRPLQSSPVGTTAVTGRAQQMQRVRYLGGRADRLLARSERSPVPPKPGEILVAGAGPMGHIYLPFELSADQLDRACRQLVTSTKIPLVLAPGEFGNAIAWTATGRHELPRDAEAVFGADYPFAEAADDLVHISHHPDSGDLVICGWCAGTQPITFASENGAHGGVGPEETRAFAILPSDTPIPDTGKDYLRPADLYKMGLHALGRHLPAPRRPRKKTASRDGLRIVTYNVHSCVGLDGKLSTSRVARVLAQCNADIVALQELDVRRARSGNMDQAHELARLLEMEFHFNAALAVEEEHYGDAVLSRLPMRLQRAGELPGAELHKGQEPRGAIWVSIDLEGRPLQLVNTHLGLLADERLLQVEALLGPDWLAHPDCQGPAILCGDFNALPGSKTYRRILRQLRDSQRSLNGHRPQKTWFSHYPLSRIDHVFLGPELKVVRIDVPRTHLARVASDHLPMVVDLQLPS